MGRYGFAVSGLVIALVGFGLTRFTVTLAAMETTAAFLFVGLIPLVLGLGLAVGGVFLAVGRYERAFVRTAAVGCLAGTIGMGALVGLTLLGDGVQEMDMTLLREQTYLSTFLIGGAVGGTLTGLYAGRNRRYRRELKHQANRLEILNRLLRDRVINHASAVKGHQELLTYGNRDHSVDVIGRKADS